MTTTSQSGEQRYSAIVKSSIENLDDPRVQGRTTHTLLNIIVMSLLGVMCGASDGEDLEDYGSTRAEWLGEFLELPEGNRTPGHDTFRRVCDETRWRNSKTISLRRIKFGEG